MKMKYFSTQKRVFTVIICLSVGSILTVSAQRVRAVIVGVSDYKYDSQIDDLNYCDDDAVEFYQYLVKKYPASRTSIVLLTDAQATRNNILYHLNKVFDHSTKNDQLIFFFSGHGYNGYFLPHDFNGTGNFLYHRDVRKVFSQSPANKKIVFADACRAGSIKIETEHANTPFGLDSYYEQLKKEKGGIVLMLSSRWNQNSFENGTLQNGYFAYHLLQGLRGSADLNNDRSIVIDELYRYVRQKVIQQSDGKQVPIIFGQFSKQMEVVRR